MQNDEDEVNPWVLTKWRLRGQDQITHLIPTSRLTFECDIRRRANEPWTSAQLDRIERSEDARRVHAGHADYAWMAYVGHERDGVVSAHGLAGHVQVRRCRVPDRRPPGGRLAARGSTRGRLHERGSAPVGRIVGLRAHLGLVRQPSSHVTDDHDLLALLEIRLIERLATTSAVCCLMSSDGTPLCRWSPSWRGSTRQLRTCSSKRTPRPASEWASLGLPVTNRNTLALGPEARET